MHFKKLRDILSYKSSETEFLLVLCCLKQIAFSSSFDELEMYQLD